MQTLTREALAARPLEPHSFYAWLPSDGWQGALAGELKSSVEEMLAAWLSADMSTLECELLDDALYYLLAARPAPAAMLRQLADRASRAYAQLLQGEKSNRALRMRLQHLNFCLRDILDAPLEVQAKQHDTGYRSPWDFLPMPQGSWWVTSDAQNVHLESRGEKKSWRLGLPSQADAIDEMRVSIGSIFSPGAWMWDGWEMVAVPHVLPLVLIWEHDHKDYGIDCRGRVFAIEHGVVTGQPLAKLPVGEVSRARKVGDAVYVFDWTQPNRMFSLRLDGFSTRVHELPDILLGNDITRHGDSFYLLDKQQGHVFTYDSQWALRGKALGFGKKNGRLFDPVAVRVQGGELYILNWLSGALVSMIAS